MKKRSKKSLQELILNIISKKKAIRHKDLSKKVEIFIEESEYDYCGNTKPKYAINRTIKRMINDEIINEHQTGFSSFLSLTKSGRQKLRNIKLSSQNHLVSTEWDGYWRIIIIDIPESRKSERDAVRYILKKAQFVQIKNSMWISPFPMEHMMIGMKEDMGLHEELMIFVTDKLDSGTEKVLEQKFIESKKEN
jgi:DNA-binding transcriptional regulator PaaX